MRRIKKEFFIAIILFIQACSSTSWHSLIRKRRQSGGSAKVIINTPTARTLMSAAIPSSGFVSFQIPEISTESPGVVATTRTTTSATNSDSQGSGRIALYVILPIIAVALIAMAGYLAWRLSRNKGQEIEINKNDVVLKANE
uniref:low-density lipoprotein receptor-related protein 8-like n=1 Tax=Styela clava TaxID=7725 RepID=UPI00193A9964|nr:low-density lipoprotein receptor-related protein 8-like [Styela clava]